MLHAHELLPAYAAHAVHAFFQLQKSWRMLCMHVSRCGLLQAGVSEGTLQPASEHMHQQGITPYDNSWQANLQHSQQGVLRYNCADSLDRTNAASYFAAVQVSCSMAMGASVRCVRLFPLCCAVLPL